MSVKNIFATAAIAGEELMLLPEKAIFWKRKNCLLVADLHLGKSGHFRKAGIPVSSKVHDHDLLRLAKVMKDFPVEKIYLLGDLFHSRHNSEWEQFTRWRNTYPAIEFHLIKGNHDVLDEELIRHGKIILHKNTFDAEPFLFSHQPIKNEDASRYQLFGHIHPGVRLHGKGLQSVSLPCFCFGEKSGVLPAFGNFTGNSIITPDAFDAVYVIYSEKVKQLFNEKHQL